MTRLPTYIVESIQITSGLMEVVSSHLQIAIQQVPEDQHRLLRDALETALIFAGSASRIITEVQRVAAIPADLLRDTLELPAEFTRRIGVG